MSVLQITTYIERLQKIHYESSADLTVSQVQKMLAILKCLEAVLTAFLIKMKF